MATEKVVRPSERGAEVSSGHSSRKAKAQTGSEKGQREWRVGHGTQKQKSAVARPWQRKFLGFSFTLHYVPKRRISPKARERFERKVRELTRRRRGVSLQELVKELAGYLRGWRSYFGYCQTPSVLKGLQRWVHKRIRAVAWKQWKTGKRRYQNLRRLGLTKEQAAPTAGLPTAWPCPTRCLPRT